MSSPSPESCSASSDFEENTVGRYGIQLYQFEQQVETVPPDEAQSAQSFSGEYKDVEIEEEEQNPHLQNSDQQVMESCMFLADTRVFIKVYVASPLCVNVQFRVCWAICPVISVARARLRLL